MNRLKPHQYGAVIALLTLAVLAVLAMLAAEPVS